MEGFSDVFKYDQKSPSGLVWLVSRGKAKAGDVAGSLKGNGYFQVGYKGKYYPCHRIVWTLLRGGIPNGFVIDHIDNNPLNNEISNLRVSTVQGNNQNRVKTKGRSSKYKGVSWNTKSGKWKSQIYFNYKGIHLGYFSSEEEAKSAYDKKASELFGDFAWRQDVEI